MTRSQAASVLLHGLALPDTQLTPLNQTWATPFTTEPDSPMKKAEAHLLIGATEDTSLLILCLHTPSHSGAGVWTDINIFLKISNQNPASILSSVTHRGTAVCPWEKVEKNPLSASCPKAQLLKTSLLLLPVVDVAPTPHHPALLSPGALASLPWSPFPVGSSCQICPKEFLSYS